MEERVKNLLWNHGIRSMNGLIFQKDNHMMDNSIIPKFGELLRGEKWYGVMEIVGYSEHPSFEREGSVAVMMETGTGDMVWCHVPDVCFNYENIKKSLEG